MSEVNTNRVVTGFLILGAFFTFACGAMGYRIKTLESDLFRAEGFDFAGRVQALEIKVFGNAGVGEGSYRERVRLLEMSVNVPPEGPPPPAFAFNGSVSPPVDFDLVGEWDLMHYGTKEKPASKGGWKGQFDLDRDGKSFTWNVMHGASGKWTLSTADLDQGQFLTWEQTWVPQNVVFSINEHSFGRLMLTDENGELYMMVRTEGGQGSPPLAYHKGSTK